MLLATMCAGMFLVLLDVTVVNVALPSITAALGAGAGGAQWVVDSYAVVIAALLLAGGAAGDRFGHRRAVLVGFAVFGAASAGCALATTVGALVAGRAAQGVGAALLLPGTLAVLTEAYPDPARRARALGTWAAVSSLALPAGPLLGGILVTAGGPPLVFAVGVPVAAVAFVAVLAVVPPSRPDRHRPLAGAASALTAIALGGSVAAVIGFAHDGPGTGPVVAAAAALAAGVALVRHERRAAAPLLPPELLTDPRSVGPTLTAATMNLVLNGSLFVLTLFLQRVQHRDPLTAGAALLPMFAPLVVLAPVAGRLTGRYGPRVPLLAGAVAAGCGAAGLALVQVDSPYPVLLVPLLGLGIGGGLCTTPVVTAALAAAPAGRAGLAGGLNNAARQAGTAVGVVVFGGVAAATAPPVTFVAGLHVLAVIGGAAWAVVLVLVRYTIGVPGPRPHAR